MKKADNTVITIYGDNNKISIGENTSHHSVAIAIILSTIVIVAVLAVSLCCPEKLVDLVRWIISMAIGG